jgi:phenylacetate-CoA ligase
MADIMSHASMASFPAALDEVAAAYDRVPFFRRLMDQADLRAHDLRTPAEFRLLPATSKVDYRRNFPAGVLMRGSTLNDPFVFRSQSSGTTGERLLTIAHTYALAERMTTTSGVNPALQGIFASAKQQRICRYAAPNCSDVECATPFTTPASRTLFDGTRVLPVAHDLLATPAAMIDQAVSEIVDYEPHWLYTDPMHLAFLCGNLRARAIAAPAVGGVVLTYNVVTKSARRQVSETLAGRGGAGGPAGGAGGLAGRARGPGGGAGAPGGAILVEVVSMSELGWMGMECPHGYVHMNTDSFYLEFLTGGRPAEPGELAELYVTSIGDQISPHLRYCTGDLYTLMAGQCPCGHHFPRVEFHGRATHVVVSGGRPLLTPKQLDDLVGPAPWLDFYKLRQLDEERIAFRYIPSARAGGDHRGQARLLGERLRAALGDKIKLTVEPVSYIECERSGKFLPCVSEVAR